MKILEGDTTYESASTSPDNHDEATEIWSAVWKRVARVIDDSGISADDENGESGSDWQRERLEVRDGVMCDSVDGSVLERDNRVVERCNRDSVDAVSGTGGVERALRAVVAYPTS